MEESQEFIQVKEIKKNDDQKIVVPQTTFKDGYEFYQWKLNMRKIFDQCTSNKIK